MFDGTAVLAKGDNRYIGGRLLVRQTFTEGNWDGLYWEGTVRIGRMDTAYSSTFSDSKGNRAELDTDNLYYGAQLSLGCEWTISDRSSLDTYVKGLWLHTEGDSVNLYDETLKYDDTDMFRIRAGAQYHRKLNEDVSFMMGATYDHINVRLMDSFLE